MIKLCKLNMNEAKQITEKLKRSYKRKEILKKDKKRAERKIESLGREDLKRRGKHRHSKKREITIKFI